MNRPYPRSLFASAAARVLPTRMVEKVWGRDVLPAPFCAPSGSRIGEIWFEPPPEMPEILVKYLFTSDKLSVQVHPGPGDILPGEDAKEECWLVLDAKPGAKLAIGFQDILTREEMRKAALGGSIENLLAWHEARPGDVFFLPPGTVHAIGPGLSLVEIQQNSDTTFRLYDYGRARELHLDRALAVARGEPYPAAHRGTTSERGTVLLEDASFRLDRVEGAPTAATIAAYPGALLALPLEGEIRTAGDGEVVAAPGECLLAPSLDALDFSAAKVSLLTRPN
jgi:mannose-6-phosphate isomerase